MERMRFQGTGRRLRRAGLALLLGAGTVLAPGGALLLARVRF